MHSYCMILWSCSEDVRPGREIFNMHAASVGSDVPIAVEHQHVQTY